MLGVQNKITNINQHGSNKSCSTAVPKRWQIWPPSEVYLKNWMFVGAYGFWDCWIPLTSDQRSFTMLSFIRDDDVSSLSDWLLRSCWHLHTQTHTELHILDPFALIFYFLSHTNAIYSYDSKGFLVILCRMKRARNVPGITHTNTEKKVCSLWHWLGHLLADPQRKRKPPTYWQSKNEKQKWKGSSHINSPTSVQCLLSLLLFLQWLIIFFHVSVKCAGDRVRPQENTDAALVMSPIDLR